MIKQINYSLTLRLLTAFFILCFTSLSAGAASSNDVSLNAILTPVNGSCGSAASPVQVVISNPGSNAQSKVPVTVVISGSGSGTLNDTLFSTLSSGGSDTFTIGTTFNTLSGGTYTIKAYTNLSTDADRTNDTSTSTVTLLAGALAPSTTGASRCGFGSLTLKAATPGPGQENIFYDSAGNIVAEGDSFVTPAIGSTTTYNVATANINSGRVGIISKAFGKGAQINNNTLGLVFKTSVLLSIDSLTVYPTKSGLVSINIVDSITGKVVATDTQTVAIASSGSAVRLAVNFRLKPGTYYMVPTNSTTGGFYRNDSTGIRYPYIIPGVIAITRPYNVVNTRYYYFYDWKVSYFGCISSLRKVTAKINPSGIKASFTTSGNCSGVTTTITDKTSSSSTIASWTYDLGDGTSFTSASSGSTTHTYIAPGTYRILQTVTSGLGCSDTSSGMINISQSPTTGFTTGAGCASSATSFRNTGSAGAFITSYVYDFGDTSSAISKSGDTTHIYKYGGSFNVKQTIITTAGCVDSAKATISVISAGSTPTVTGASRCGFGSLTLFATPPKGLVSVFFDSAASGNIVARGDSFVTPNISSTTTYYAASVNLISSKAGLATLGAGGVLVPSTLYGLAFKAISDFTLDSLTVYPTASGTVQINITDSATGTTLFTQKTSVTVSTTTSGTAVRIGLGFRAKAGGKYHIDGNGTTMSMYRSTGLTYPFTDPGVVSITRVIGTAGRYYFFYDWLVSTYGCFSNRVAVTATVTTTGSPTAGFTVGPKCMGKATSFTDASTAASGTTIKSYKYDFGDGSGYTSASSGSTTHNYAAAGSYKVILTVTTSAGCSDTAAMMITVDSVPIASFNFGTSCLGSATTFSNTSKGNNILSYTYDFGDTSTSTSTSLSSTPHTYKYAGAHNVGLIALNSAGCTDTSKQVVTITASPSAPVVTSTSTCGPGSITLKASKATAGASNYFFANTTTDTVLANADTFVTSIPGTYYVASIYSASYSVGIKSNKVGTGAVINNNTLGLAFKAYSDFTLDSVTVYPGASGDVVVRLLDSSTGKVIDSVIRAVTVSASGNPVRIGIGFKLMKGTAYNLDAVGSTVSGMFRTGTGTSFPYKLTGIVSITGPYNVVNTRFYYFYNWRVSVRSCSSSRTAIRANIGGAAKPTPKFSINSVCAGLATTFTDLSSSSSGSITKWSYDFGDGTSASSTGSGGFTHVYSKGGSYKATLTVSVGSCSDTASMTVNVLLRPKAGFTSSAACFGTASGFKDNSIGSGLSYLYSFGDGTTDTAKSPVHTYKKDSVYSVMQVVSNGSCMDTFTTAYSVYANPVASLSASGFCTGATTTFTNGSTAGSGTISSLLIDYNDGSPKGKSINPHLYNAGKYKPTLTVTNSNGCATTTTDSFTIYSTPSAGFNLSGIVCRTVSLKAQDTLTSGNTFSFDFGSYGAIAKGIAVTHTYVNDSSYTISLTTMNGSCSAKHDSTITVICTGMAQNTGSTFFMNVYPNPFKGTTTISYSLNSAASVKIEIYDMLGRKLYTLLEHKQEAGSYDLKFTTPENAGAGMYMITMNDGTRVITRTIISAK
jgi:PKD repeat protein